SAETAAPAPQAIEAAKPAEPAESAPQTVEAAKPVETPEPAPQTVEVVKPTEAKPVETATAPAPIIVDERPKTMPRSVVQEANGRPLSVFASLKEGKLYVRQGWKPLFDAPISFENPGQPVGTHVYTAMGMKDDGKGMRWTV